MSNMIYLQFFLIPFERFFVGKGFFLNAATYFYFVLKIYNYLMTQSSFKIVSFGQTLSF